MRISWRHVARSWLLCLLLAHTNAYKVYHRVPKPPTRPPKSVIIGFESNDPQQTEASVQSGIQEGLQVGDVQASTASIRIKGARKLDGAKRRNTFVVDADSEATVEDLVNKIKPGSVVAGKKVAYVEPDYPRYITSMPSECPANINKRCIDGKGFYWHIVNTNTDTLWAKIDFGGMTKTAGIIDTGIFYKHTELQGVVDVARSRTCIDGSCSGDGLDDNGHGTHCAGVIAAAHNSGAAGKTPLGILSKAKLISCKFMDDEGSGWTSDASNCVYHLIQQGASVISNSWGGGGVSITMQEATLEACRNDVLFIVAAGNDGRKVENADGGDPTYPAFYAEEKGMECVLSVAATDKQDRLAKFSNFGEKVLVSAPGEDIYSTWYFKKRPDVNDGAFALSGTSMSAPMVAGVALGLRNLYPSLTALQIKQVIIQNGKDVDTSRRVGKIIDVDKAVAAAAKLAGQEPPKPDNPKSSPSPKPGNGPDKCTPEDCANTNKPVCIPDLGCQEQTTCPSSCRLDDYFDQYCWSACGQADPKACNPTPKPAQTSCKAVDARGSEVSGLCNDQGHCVGECLDDSQCNSPRKSYCYPEIEWRLEPSKCAECSEDRHCPRVPAGVSRQCVDKTGDATWCSLGECSYWVFTGDACTTDDGRKGTCGEAGTCSVECTNPMQCEDVPAGYMDGCYSASCVDGQCWYAARPKEPCKVKRNGSTRQGVCNRNAKCNPVACPNEGAVCYSNNDCCSKQGGPVMVCLPKGDKGRLRCQAQSISNGRRLS